MKLKLRLILILLVFANLKSLAQVSSDKESVAREWIASQAKELHIQPYHTFKLTFVRKSLAGETLRFQQMLHDVPVFDNEIVVNFAHANEVTFTSNNYDETIANINTIPVLTANEAIAKSNKTLAFKGVITHQECKLVVCKISNQTKLAYRVVTNAFDMSGSWEVMIDAQSGAVLSTKDVAVYHHKKEKKKKNEAKGENKNALKTTNFVNGSAYVYIPDPLSQAHVAYAGDYVDNSDATNASLDAARTRVTLPEIDYTSGVYKLKSSFVEIKDLEAPSKGLFTQATPDFLFDRAADNFEAANAFYHLDDSMRYINFTLGIPCIPLTNSGVLWFDPSGDNGADNSYYSSGTLVFGEGGVDDAEDSDVILHEMGHGIHDWITGGHSSSSTGLGEGSGDYWAMSYSRSLNQWASNEPAYNWVFSWDGHNEWWSGRVTNYTRTYPQTGSTYTEIHTYGQIWATALMKIYDVIGRTKTDKAFLEGLALTNSSSNQKTAAAAVRQAAINMNYPCADIQTMTDKFNAAGYALTALPLTMAAIADQTVAADANNTYTLPSFSSLANPIVANCNAVVTQSPVIGTVLAPGTYSITMTATSGTATVSQTFTLTITPNLTLNENSKTKVAVFPNPTKNQITIKGDFEANESVTIYNLLGQKVTERKLLSNEETIDVSKYESGLYTIYFNVSKASYKFIKE
ncbi:T9SS type A sorting domain-containing protein [Flavobacterium aciduliphilum]|uniref:Putative secreted protein (Por secretion system target) n=1 Tax=Flavobacterium aciduliphilum TaxID=1101402 RepID=A0A328YUE9_9FLAO|nr:T9SS type A sorting domain-containing protein [Flavobacterium aciduliphilum]RAR74177.1 putative secreted protein (Por secretion system target) [Flavobacterium aciduliphilum]